MDAGIILGIFSLLAVTLGFGFGFFVSRGALNRQARLAGQEAERIVRQAEQEAQAKTQQVSWEEKSRAQRLRAEFERETREQRGELLALERRVLQREQGLDKRASSLDRRENDLGQREKEFRGRERALARQEAEYKKALSDLQERLERSAGLTAEEARRQLMELAEREIRAETDRLSKRVEDAALEKAERRARDIVVSAMERLAVDCASDAATAVVHLPQEDMKGRIIGREGRNIRALENATGASIHIGEFPQSVLVSSFDPLRREIGRIALERLIADGKIHPTRIEEVVARVRQDLERQMTEEARKTLSEFRIGRRVHPEILKLLAQLKFKTVQGRNALQHAREAASLCGLMAQELGLDGNFARRAALLHDIGRAVGPEAQESHALAGAEAARRYGESPKLVNAIAAHHGEVKPDSAEAVLVSVAQDLSASRPGARREDLEAQIKRLRDLEEMAKGLQGVEEAYALQAGREVRIIVRSSEVSEEGAARVAREAARRVEQDLSDLGPVQVTVVRESRHVEEAGKARRAVSEAKR